MNPRAPRPEDQRIREEIDRLVDDELGETQRRELIERLERLPDGWRRCALAFLEAQCWRRVLAVHEPDDSVAPRGSGTVAETTTRLPRCAGEAPAAPWPRTTDRGRHPTAPAASAIRILLAMAASFLVAFVLGTAWRWGWLGTATGDGSATGNAPQVAGAPGTFDGGRPAASPVLPGSPAAPSLVPSEPPALARDQAPSQPGDFNLENPRPLGTVRLSVPVSGDGPARSIELPVVEGDSVGAEWLRDLPAAVPPDVVRALEHSGMNVEQQRDVLRFRTPDGRALVVPVERLEVTRAEGPKL